MGGQTASGSATTSDQGSPGSSTYGIMSLTDLNHDVDNLLGGPVARLDTAQPHPPHHA